MLRISCVICLWALLLGAGFTLRAQPPAEVWSLAMTDSLIVSVEDLEIKIPGDTVNIVDLSHYAATSGKPLTKIPQRVFELYVLDTLDLSHNALQQIPAKISNLQLLHCLDLSHNALTTLPRELVRMRGLRILRLQGNPMDPGILDYIRQRRPDLTIAWTPPPKPFMPEDFTPETGP